MLAPVITRLHLWISTLPPPPFIAAPHYKKKKKKEKSASVVPLRIKGRACGHGTEVLRGGSEIKPPLINTTICVQKPGLAEGSPPLPPRLCTVPRKMESKRDYLSRICTSCLSRFLEDKEQNSEHK